MENQTENIENDKEDIKEKLMLLMTEDFALNIKILGLTSLLMDKGIITQKEVETYYKKVIEVFGEGSVKYGLDSEAYKKFLTDYLDLN